MKPTRLTLFVLAAHLLLTALPALAQSDSEPNNTIGAASPLPLDTFSNGAVGTVDDPFDWYQIVVPSDGELTITVTHNPSDFQFGLFGLTEDDIILLTETNAASGRQLVRTLEAGTFFIQVNSRGNPNSIGYTISADLLVARPVSDDIERNDTLEASVPITLNATQVGHISHTLNTVVLDNVDYYSFSLGADSDVTFTLSHDPVGFGIQYFLYGEDGVTDILGTETNYPSGDSRFRTLAAGDYFWAVNGRGETVGRTYDARIQADPHPPVTADVEPNDGTATASALTVNVTETGHISFTLPSVTLDNADYHLLSVPGPGDVTLTVQYDPPEELFNSSCSVRMGKPPSWEPRPTFPRAVSGIGRLRRGIIIGRSTGEVRTSAGLTSTRRLSPRPRPAPTRPNPTTAWVRPTRSTCSMAPTVISATPATPLFWITRITGRLRSPGRA